MSWRSNLHCPNCKVDMRGPDGGSRWIGVEYPQVYDGVSEWRCPDCGYRENRWTGDALADGETPRRR